MLSTGPVRDFAPGGAEWQLSTHFLKQLPCVESASCFELDCLLFRKMRNGDRKLEMFALFHSKHSLSVSWQVRWRRSPTSFV